jgi:hypothetical protein
MGAEFSVVPQATADQVNQSRSAETERLFLRFA